MSHRLYSSPVRPEPLNPRQTPIHWHFAGCVPTDSPHDFTKAQAGVHLQGLVPAMFASILQAIVADCHSWVDLDVDSFIRAACIQFRHLTGNGRAADMQFKRHLFPTRTNQSRLGIDPLPKVLHYPLSKIKRNLRRTPPRSPRCSMWFRHTVSFLSLYSPHTNRPKPLFLRSEVSKFP